VPELGEDGQGQPAVFAEKSDDTAEDAFPPYRFVPSGGMIPLAAVLPAFRTSNHRKKPVAVDQPMLVDEHQDLTRPVKPCGPGQEDVPVPQHRMHAGSVNGNAKLIRSGHKR